MDQAQMNWQHRWRGIYDNENSGGEDSSDGNHEEPVIKAKLPREGAIGSKELQDGGLRRASIHTSHAYFLAGCPRVMLPGGKASCSPCGQEMKCYARGTKKVKKVYLKFVGLPVEGDVLRQISPRALYGAGMGAGGWLKLSVATTKTLWGGTIVWILLSLDTV